MWLNRGDLNGMVADFAPTFEYIASGARSPAPGVYRGPEGLKEFMGCPGDTLEALIDRADQDLLRAKREG